jgi:RecG-like helicase
MAPEGCVNYLRLASQIKVDERLVVYDEKKSGVRAVSESHADFCSQQLKRLAELQTKLTEAAKSELAKSAKEMSEVSHNMRCSLGDWCAGRTVRAYVDAMAAKEGLEIAAVDSGQSEAIDLTELCGFPHVLCRVLEALRALLAESSDKQALIFVCSSYEAKAISDFLNATSQSITGGDIKSACITSIGQTALKSNNSQSKAALAQQAILDRFRQGAINVLVSSSMLPHQLSL